MKINDVQNKKFDKTVMISARIAVDDKLFLEKNNINLTKLIRTAIEELKQEVSKDES